MNSARISADPKLDQVWFILSEIHEREGRLKESLEFATKALTILHKLGGHADNIAIVRERIARLQAALR